MDQTEYRINYMVQWIKQSTVKTTRYKKSNRVQEKPQGTENQVQDKLQGTKDQTEYREN